uniref:Capsid protein n=1 Tax=Peanut stunt virus TaxID=12313 RepID=A0A2Z6E298_9BROM|nr:coat protein [Peanut stunt virus]BBD78665.1 coat protein [Peanut stunt virus]
MASKGSGNGSRRPRRGRRSFPIKEDAHARELRAVTAQLNRLVALTAARMPTLDHPTFVSSRKCAKGYTYTSLDVRPTKTEKGHSFGQRLNLPVPVSEFPKKKVSCVQLRLNPSPTFDSTVWVTLRKLPPGYSLASESVFKLFTDGLSAVLMYQHVPNGIQRDNKIIYDLSPVGTEIGDMSEYAIIVYSKDDTLEDDEMLIHVDVEHQRIPSATALPI